MNLIIVGSTGGTGRCLVEQALEQGHTVTAFARNPAKITIQHPNLSVVQGDVLDRATVKPALNGKDAVLSALGVRKLRKTTVLSEGTRNIITAMQQHGVRRLIVESSLGVGDSRGQFPWYLGLLVRIFLRNIYADKEVQEAFIRESGLDWTIVRPAGLTNGARRGVYRQWVGKPDAPITGWISRADVADFMLKQLTDTTYLRQAVGLSY